MISLAGTGAAARDQATLLPGIYSNEEQVYFDREAGRTASPLTYLTVQRETGGALITLTDAFGLPVGPSVAANRVIRTKVGATFRFEDGTA
jgi:hypothetical protein